MREEKQQLYINDVPREFLTILIQAELTANDTPIQKKAHAGGTSPCSTSQAPRCSLHTEQGFLETQNSNTLGTFYNDYNVNFL